MLLYALAQMIIIDLVALDCIPKNPTDRLSMDGSYESANQQRKLTTWIEGYTKTPSDTMVAVNSFCIIFSKATTFKYEIRQPDPLTQTLFYYQIHYNKHYFPHILGGKCSELQHTLYIFLHWFPISIHPFLTYSFNTNERKQKKKTR
jgi:hypothetical protein